MLTATETTFILKKYGGPAAHVNDGLIIKIKQLRYEKNKIFGLIASLFLIFSACETEVVDPAGLRDVGVVPGIEDFIPQTFDVLDLNNTFIQFTVIVDDPNVNEVIVLASVNGDKRRTEITRVSSFPGTVKLMLSELASKLGMQLNDVKLGDIFNIELQTIKDGKTYFSSAAFNAGVVCAYDPELVTGSYRAFSARLASGWECNHYG
jgi:hypothetical protein